MVFLWPTGFPIVDFPWWEGVLEDENHTQINYNYNYPPRILQLSGQVCPIKNTC